MLFLGCVASALAVLAAAGHFVVTAVAMRDFFAIVALGSAAVAVAIGVVALLSPQGFTRGHPIVELVRYLAFFAFAIALSPIFAIAGMLVLAALVAGLPFLPFIAAFPESGERFLRRRPLPVD